MLASLWMEHTPTLAERLGEQLSDSSGTLFYTCLVALLGTVARYFGRFNLRWSWLVNMFLFHGLAALYIKTSCNKPVVYGMQTVHDALCFGAEEYENDGSPLFWSSVERYIWTIGAILGVCVNVIPKYMSGDEATRHMYHVKQGTMNPLLFHIVGGIMTLLASGFVMIYCDYTGQLPSYQWLKVVYFCDIIHQLGINRMLRNHDGIWFLRCGNQASGIGKMIVMLNMANKPIAQVDNMFFASCGFLGTRVWCSVMFMLNYAGFPAPTLAFEYWYSMGVMAAHITVYFRGWKIYGLLWWLCVVNSSTMYFHQLWRPWLQYRTQFIYLCIVLTVLVASVPTPLGMAITMGFAYTGFQIPHFKREPMSSDVTKMLNIFQETKSIPQKDIKLAQSRGADILAKTGFKADEDEDEEEEDDDMLAIQSSFENIVKSRQSVAVSRFFTGKKIL